MTMLGHHRRTSLELPQAAHGRFFDGSTQVSSESLFDLSREFYVMHGSLFNGKVGLVVQVGETEAGEYVDLNDRESSGHTMVTSVFFDARQSSERSYGWQVTQAKIGAGREVSRLYSVPGFSFATQGSFDPRGSLYSRTRSVETTDMALAALSGALGCGLAGDRISELYQQKQEAETALRRFAVEALLKHSSKRHQDEVVRAEKNIDGICFSALGLTDVYNHPMPAVKI